MTKKRSFDNPFISLSMPYIFIKQRSIATVNEVVMPGNLFFYHDLYFLSLFLSFIISQGIEATISNPDWSFLHGPIYNGRMQSY